MSTSTPAPPSQSQTQQQNPPDDPFDSLLTLEDTLYTSAYDLGVQDGARAGRIEGRIFGLEKGFEKFAAMGELHGRAAVWGSRIPTKTKTPSSSSAQTASTPSAPELDPHCRSGSGRDSDLQTSPVLPLLGQANERLKRNIALAYHLTDPATFSTQNTEESVADFDDRFKRAGAKVKVVERVIGEGSSLSPPTLTSSLDAGEKGEEVREFEGEVEITTTNEEKKKGKTSPVRVQGLKNSTGSRRTKNDDSIEDFAGSSRLLG